MKVQLSKRTWCTMRFNGVGLYIKELKYIQCKNSTRRVVYDKQVHVYTTRYVLFASWRVLKMLFVNR